VKRSVLALRLIGVGFFIGISIVLGVVVGRWLDEKFHTTFVFTIAGLFLGLISAFYGTWQLIKPLLYNNDKGDD
jgi:F0F1-type ATP synthase assembly protein I